uniref:Homologous-pairing protein 2 homolog n=1 Tax=Apteryx owenii TaxID=8824 RepID=A0A8B9PL13_APTOW
MRISGAVVLTGRVNLSTSRGKRLCGRKTRLPGFAHGASCGCSCDCDIRQELAAAPRISAAAAVLLRYLQEQNRPYSAQDAFGNLQREHGLGKAAVAKALEQLAQQGRIREKAYGKQKIYFADQEQLPAASDAELRGLDGNIAALSTEVQALQQSCRRMEAELKDLNGSMTTPEMAREVEELKKDCASYTEKLERIKSATNHVTPEEKEKVSWCWSRGSRSLLRASLLAVSEVCSEQKLYCKEWRRRKRMATELFDAILEGYPKSKKQFFEEVGIETDEDHNVTLPAAV